MVPLCHIPVLSVAYRFVGFYICFIMIKEITNAKEFDDSIKEGRVLVDFYALWCGPCKMLAPIVEKVIEENPEVDLLRVNVDENEELAVRYNIVSIPTLIYFENGQIKHGNVGYIGEEEVKKIIDVL